MSNCFCLPQAFVHVNLACWNQESLGNCRKRQIIVGYCSKLRPILLFLCRINNQCYSETYKLINVHQSQNQSGGGIPDCPLERSLLQIRKNRRVLHFSVIIFFRSNLCINQHFKITNIESNNWNFEWNLILITLKPHSKQAIFQTNTKVILLYNYKWKNLLEYTHPQHRLTYEQLRFIKS